MENKTEEIKSINISELKPYEQQPFKVLIDESMEELMESVKQSGVSVSYTHLRAHET